ncbi:MarC family protein [Acidomonas methanolica]|uniref:MarC family protein n=1 Tax=Acidomonas methanolica TaxID=437 RepID=UPI00211A373A|nr:MarC family protein [Acidomonas methanolica]MCQ9155107.1 MarC family protein [Acidomonas methanolica]
MDKTEFIKACGTFLAIVNPFLSLPVFLAMTTGMTQAEQRTLAFKITAYAAIMCAIILFCGQEIIAFFGITIDQFRIAGGIVLAHIAWSMLNGGAIASHQGSPQEKAQMQDLSGLAFYPFTFPLVVGPGTVATIIIYAANPAYPNGKFDVGIIVTAILLILLGVLFFAARIGKVMSDTIRGITIRLMGMILLAIAVGMIADGVKAIFHAA